MLGFEGFAGLAMRVQGRAWKQEWMWGFLDFGLGVGAKGFRDFELSFGLVLPESKAWAL